MVHPGDHRDSEETGKEPQEQAPSSNLCQALFYLSLDKFHLGSPSLLRQVLITNTLHHLREEMKLERGPNPPQEFTQDLLLHSTAQSILGLRSIQDCCESPDLSCSPTSASDCRQIPSPLWSSASPSVRDEEPAQSSFESMNSMYLGDLVPDDFSYDIDTSSVERDPWSSFSALASSPGVASSPGQPGTGWDGNKLDQYPISLS